MAAARSDETDGGGGPPVQANPGLSQNGAPPPFLSKTYDMVDDAETDAVISWGAQNNSFVVWDQSELARLLLPKYFKHGNFSSFVRQLNTYGFKKVDPDKWEFANEGFLRGQKHLLKKISRRKPSHVHSQAQQPQSQNASTASCVEVGKFGVEEEIERLKRDKNVLMQELVRLRQQQQESDSQLQILGNRLQGMENRQKLMMSFLAKAMRSPGLFSQLVQQNESNCHIAGLNKKQRFLRQDQSAPSPDGQIIKYQPLTNEMLKLDSLPGSLLLDTFSMLPEVAQNEAVPSFSLVTGSAAADQDIDMLSEIPMAIPCELPASDIPIEDFVVSEGEHMPTVEADSDPKLLDIMDSLLEEFIAASPECGEMEVGSSLLEAAEMQQQPKSVGCENAGNVDNLMAQMGLLTS